MWRIPGPDGVALVGGLCGDATIVKIIRFRLSSRAALPHERNHLQLFSEKLCVLLPASPMTVWENRGGVSLVSMAG